MDTAVLPAPSDPAANDPFPDDIAPPRPWRRAVRDAYGHRSLLLGTIICAILGAAMLLAPVIAPGDATAPDPMSAFAEPSWTHPMGADSFGRDLLARVLYGGRVTVLASAAVVLLGGLAGTALGLLAGYAGGLVRFLIMRLIDLLLAFPGILLALAVSAVLGPGLLNGVVAVAVVLVPIYARLVEGATAEVRHLPYVQAAVTLGAGAPHIVLRHVLPNVSPGIVVLTTTWLGVAALWIAALGFIGLGVQPPLPELGAILNDGQAYITIAWWTTVFPGVFLALFVVGVNLVGDGLRDELDPTLARR